MEPTHDEVPEAIKKGKKNKTLTQKNEEQTSRAWTTLATQGQCNVTSAIVNEVFKSQLYTWKHE